MEQWQGQGIVISNKAFGEKHSITTVLTKDHGVYSALVYGGISAKRRLMLQPGNSVEVSWRARQLTQLGHFTVELTRARTAELIARRDVLLAFNSLVHLVQMVVPERVVASQLFDAMGGYLEKCMEGRGWREMLVYCELVLLKELGVGLDIHRCVVTGSAKNLTYISPKTGGAVTLEAGRPYHDKLFSLPSFMLSLPEDVTASALDISHALKATEHFILHRLLMPEGMTLPPERRQLSTVICGNTPA